MSGQRREPGVDRGEHDGNLGEWERVVHERCATMAPTAASERSLGRGYRAALTEASSGDCAGLAALCRRLVCVLEELEASAILDMTRSSRASTGLGPALRSDTPAGARCRGRSPEGPAVAALRRLWAGDSDTDRWRQLIAVSGPDCTNRAEL